MTKDATTLSETELHSAINLLRELIPEEELNRMQPSSPHTVYTTLVTLWMLVLQRLGCGETLTNVVRDVVSDNREILPQNKRVREGTLSLSSAAYSNARQRLALPTAEYLANRVSHSIINSSPPSWFEDRRVFILDGTTITLEPRANA
jgi:hypothetical protein